MSTIIDAKLLKARIKRNAKRRRRPTEDQWTPVYVAAVRGGDVLSQMRRPVDRSKYSPDVCKREGKR